MMNAKRMGRHAAAGLAVAVAIGAGSAVAGEATIFAERDFQGPAMTVRGPSPSVDRIGVNDTAASIVVRSGVFEVCSKPNFEGYCAQLQPGEYSSFGTSVNDRVASLREVTQPLARAPDGATATPPVHANPSLAQPNPPIVQLPAAPANAMQPAGARVVFYEQPNFRGRSIVIDRPVISRLSSQGFVNGAGSMRIEGGNWFFCSDSDFAGHCQTFGPGEYAHLPWTQERIASGYFVPAS
jgi:hypothetical protein